MYGPFPLWRIEDMESYCIIIWSNRKMSVWIREKVLLIWFTCNFGKSNGLRCGLQESRGETEDQIFVQSKLKRELMRPSEQKIWCCEHIAGPLMQQFLACGFRMQTGKQSSWQTLKCCWWQQGCSTVYCLLSQFLEQMQGLEYDLDLLLPVKYSSRLDVEFGIFS